MSRQYTANGKILHLVKLKGPLAVSQAEAVVQRFEVMAAHGVAGLIVDLTEVPFIDSRGLAALVRGYQLFGRDARNFQLAGLQDQPKLVFELTGFDRIFQINEELNQLVFESHHWVLLDQNTVSPLATIDMAA